MCKIKLPISIPPITIGDWHYRTKVFLTHSNLEYKSRLMTIVYEASQAMREVFKMHLLTYRNSQNEKYNTNILFKAH